MNLTKLIKKFRIDHPDRFRLSDFDCADTCGLDIEKAEAKAMLADGVERLARLQEKLLRAEPLAVLRCFRRWMRAGKDGAIKHVMSGVNPQGCQVHSFKAPSAEELDHDFLWRIGKALPERGRIGIFNRSHYEEVLVARVPRRDPRPPAASAPGPDQGHLAGALQVDPQFRKSSCAQRHAGAQVLPACLEGGAAQALPGTARRARQTLEVRDGGCRRTQALDKYMQAYEDTIRHTSRPEAPWYVVTADNKGFARLIIAEAMVEAMEGLDLAFPKVEGPALKELEKVRRALLADPKQGRKRLMFAIRRYAEGDHAAVRALFIAVNRALAPAGIA